MHSRITVPAALLLAAAFYGLAGAEETPPNVLFLTVDTLRADRLGCYGHDEATSPNLDALAAEGMLFEDMICEVPLTSPSFCSMLSSRFPRSNGTTRNGLALPADVPVVAEQFKAAGYRTFCVQSNWTLKDKLSGLGRGFDEYDDDFHKKRWGFIKPERGGDEVTARALALLGDGESPFFAWIHYSDPHAPYELHKNFNIHGKKAWIQNKEDKVRIKYDSEIAYTDDQIKLILDAIPENTIVIFVGDHGESLYDHGYLGHGRRIYQAGLHVPLIIRAPGLAPGRSAKPVRGVDIGPTLLDLAGLAPLPGMMGASVLSADIPDDRVRVVETFGGAVPNLPGAKALMADADPMRQGVLLSGWKLITQGRDEELYYLPGDPDELENVAVKHPERVAALRKLIAGWDATVEKLEVPEGNALNADDIEALRSLGYVD